MGSAPFEITRVGWGYFPITVIVTWHPFLEMESLEIEHELCFDDDGNSSFHVAQLSDVGMQAALSRTSARNVSTGIQNNASDASRPSNRRVRSVPRQSNQTRVSTS